MFDFDDKFIKDSHLDSVCGDGGGAARFAPVNKKCRLFVWHLYGRSHMFGRFWGICLRGEESRLK